MRRRLIRVVVVALALPAWAQRPAAPAVPQVAPSTAPTAPPVLALRGFARVSLYPGEGRKVHFDVPAKALFVRDNLGKLVPPTGPIDFFVGASSRDIRLRETLHTLGAPR